MKIFSSRNAAAEDPTWCQNHKKPQKNVSFLAKTHTSAHTGVFRFFFKSEGHVAGFDRFERGDPSEFDRDAVFSDGFACFGDGLLVFCGERALEGVDGRFSGWEVGVLGDVGTLVVVNCGAGCDSVVTCDDLFAAFCAFFCFRVPSFSAIIFRTSSSMASYSVKRSSMRISFLAR